MSFRAPGRGGFLSGLGSPRIAGTLTVGTGITMEANSRLLVDPGSEATPGIASRTGDSGIVLGGAPLLVDGGFRAFNGTVGNVQVAEVGNNLGLGGGIFFRNVETPAAWGVDQNNFVVDSSTTILAPSASAAGIDLTGISGGAQGRILFIINVGATNPINLVNESASSTAANRLRNGSGADISLPAGGMALYVYNTTTSRWGGGRLG